MLHLVALFFQEYFHLLGNILQYLQRYLEYCLIRLQFYLRLILALQLFFEIQIKVQHFLFG